MPSVSQLKAEIAALNKKIIELQGIISTQTATIVARDFEIATLKAEIVVLKARIAELEGTVPPPEPPPPPPPPPSSDDYPNATNTGVPAGTTLQTMGRLEITGDGQVVTGKEVNGELVVNGEGATLRSCRIIGDSFWTLPVLKKGLILEDCEIRSVYRGGNAKGVYLDDAATDFALRRCNIHTVEDGVYISTRRGLVEFCYIHDLWADGYDPHFDGIQLHGGVTSDIILRRNAVMLTNQMNSCITMGTVQNVLMDENKLYGGAYTVRVDGRFGDGSVQNVELRKNRFGPNLWGHWTFDLCNPILNGNVDDLTGELIN